MIGQLCSPQTFLSCVILTVHIFVPGYFMLQKLLVDQRISTSHICICLFDVHDKCIITHRLAQGKCHYLSPCTPDTPDTPDKPEEENPNTPVAPGPDNPDGWVLGANGEKIYRNPEAPSPDNPNGYVMGAHGLPQTGQLKWPIPVLAVTGVVLVAAGIKLKKGTRKDEK